MAKKYLVTLMFMLVVAMPRAQEIQKLSADVTMQALSGYNYTHGWYFGADIKGKMSIDNVDVALNMEALSKSVYAFGLSVAPSFKVCKNGYVFVDGTLHSRMYSKFKTYDFIYAGSLGYKMRHFLAQVGIYGRVIGNSAKESHSTEGFLVEPFNLLYRLTVSIKGFDHPWDVYLTGSNFNEFEFERMAQPIFTLGGRWNFKERWSAVAEGMLKLSGFFHQNVSFYEALLRIGINYKL